MQHQQPIQKIKRHCPRLNQTEDDSESKIMRLKR
jgi:hypothetical protein